MKLQTQWDGSYVDLDLLDAGTPNAFPVGHPTVQAWIDAGNTPTPYVAPVKTWEENRQAEYPTIAELVVALYDTDDKAAIEKRRSDVKAKYPKPE
jgi:hypothetical protein